MNAPSAQKQKSKKKLDLEEFSVPIEASHSDFLSELLKNLSQEVVGQDRAVSKIVSRISIIESGIQNNEAPPSPLLFAGPTGSGKTYLAEMAAKLWLGDTHNNSRLKPIVKIAGENYTNHHYGATLMGSPPGYVGYKDKSPLEDIGEFDRARKINEIQRMIDRCRSRYLSQHNLSGKEKKKFNEYCKQLRDREVEKMKPFRSVLLVDEIEKMHPTIQKQFLNILNDGELRMHNGRVVDFRNCLIIFTSNIGSEQINKEAGGNPIGFVSHEAEDKKQKSQDKEIYKIVKREVINRLDPALYGRIGKDGVVAFRFLTNSDYEKIVGLEIGRVQASLVRHSDSAPVSIYTTSRFRNFILNQADARREGARQIKRLVAKHMREPLARCIESEELSGGDKILFDAKTDEHDGEIKVEIKRTSRENKNTSSLSRDKIADAEQIIDKDLRAFFIKKD